MSADKPVPSVDECDLGINIVSVMTRSTISYICIVVCVLLGIIVQRHVSDYGHML
jgi:hypothetical protein